jgi:hypothetical protein
MWCVSVWYVWYVWVLRLQLRQQQLLSCPLWHAAAEQPQC